MSEEKILKDQAEKLRAIIKKDAKKTVKRLLGYMKKDKIYIFIAFFRF